MQERSEVATQSRYPGSIPDGDTAPATVRDLGLTRKQIHEAHQTRDAEMATLHHLQLPARACSLQTRKGGGCGLEFVHAASFGK